MESAREHTSGTNAALSNQLNLAEASTAQNHGHCTFCILAEFDIDRGSTLAHQYPLPTGYDEHMLAELMLPDGAHARSEDWTIFFLKPPDRVASSSNDNSLEPAKAQTWSSQGLTYVINLVRTKHDSSVRRGALVKALAIGTRHPFIDVFKPALLMALDDYFKAPGIECLADLYDAINKLDLSLAPAYTKAERAVLRASDRRDLLEERFGHLNESAEAGEASGVKPIPENDMLAKSQDSAVTRSRKDSTSTISSETKSVRKRFSVSSLRPTLRTRGSSSGSIPVASGVMTDRRSSLLTTKPRDTHYYDTTINYRSYYLPVRVPLTIFPEEVGEYSLIKLIQTFSGPHSTPVGPLHPHLHTSGASTHPIILLFNSLVTQKRIIFLGYGQPAGLVASFVLAACALGSGCGAVLKGFAARAFPYTNLLNLDDLEKVPGYIAGVTNPRFEDLHAWDVLFNVATGKVQVAKDIAAAESAPQAVARGKSATLPRDGVSSHSLASLSGALSSGPESRSQDLDFSQFGMMSAASSGFVGKASSLGGVIGEVRDRAGATADGKLDTASPLFMEELQAAIASHFGERYVRCRFTEYCYAFVRGVARHEEHFYGHTTLPMTCQPFLNGQLGAGPVYVDRESELREIMANQMRVEGFRFSIAYQLLFKDLEAQGGFTEAITDFDIAHQIGRLRRAKSLAIGEAELIFDTIAKSVVTQDQITELLALLPPHAGGLLPLGLGLFHPNTETRDSAIDILLRLCEHSIGKKMVQSMQTYQRLAFARLTQARAERKQMEDSYDSALSRPVSFGTYSTGPSEIQNLYM